MKAAVIGDGGWGTALAMVLERNGHDVTVWGRFQDQLDAIKQSGENRRFLPGVALPASIQWTANESAAVNGAGLVALVIPSRFYHEVLGLFKRQIPAGAVVVSATKGLDEQSRERMSTVAERVLGRPVAVLSGPSHAEEVACGIPCAVAVAAADTALAEMVQDCFMSEVFRVYTLDDVVGVELGGALKNVIAIAAGISDGLGFGDNTKAALITRGMAEIMRLGEALGAQAKTFTGLSGIGDLVVTCTSRHSRNRRVGERLGRGESIQSILEDMKMVAEGVFNCRVACDLASANGVPVPIAEEVNAVVHAGKSPQAAMLDLMTRAPKSERD